MLENPCLHQRRHAAAVILDFDPDLATVVTAAQGDRASAVDRLPGVDQQVHEYLVELRRNAAHDRQLAEVADHPGLVLEFVPDDVQSALQPLVKVGILPFGR